MIHQESLRMVPQAQVAVLFIHGICGSPNHFRTLIPLESQIPAHWSVHNLVLPGHCASVSDFAHSSMRAWKQYARRCFDDLCRNHDKVIIVAHSMGTLFAYDLANRRPNKVAFLFLIASPVVVGVRYAAVKNCIRLALGKGTEEDPVLQAMGQATGIALTPNLLKYISWAPRMVELLKEAKASRSRLPRLSVPCFAWQSKKDEVVSQRAGKLLHRSGHVEVHTLPASTHYYYDPQDREQVEEAFAAACKTYIIE